MSDHDYDTTAVRQAKLGTTMNAYGALKNRKRPLIARAHSMVLLGIALRSFASPKDALIVRAPGPRSA